MRWCSARRCRGSPGPRSRGAGRATEMKLRIFLPASDRPGGAPWSWMLLDARGGLLRSDSGPPEDMPRADDVELVLPAARVLFARLALPRVGATTLRDLLPYA